MESRCAQRWYSGRRLKRSSMLRWIIVLMLALALIGWLSPFLRRIGLGRLPGDIHFVRGGREYNFPFASSLLLSALLTLLIHLLH